MRRARAEGSSRTKQPKRGLPLGAAALLGVVSVFWGSAATAQAPPPIGSSPSLVIHMETPQAGWALYGHTLYHTGDGGRAWQAVTPPGVHGVAVAGGIGAMANAVWSPTGAQDAWVASMGTSATQLEISRTSDGGRRWHQVVSAVPALAANPLFQVDALSHTVGWVVLSPGALGGSLPITVLRTEDGGRRWHTVNRSVTDGGLIKFFGPQVGVMLVQRAPGRHGMGFTLYRTTDGATHWRTAAVQTIPGFDSLTAGSGLSVSLSGAHGLLAGSTVAASTHPYLAVLRTTDGGRRWNGRSPALTVSPTRFWDLDTLGGHLAWAAADGVLWRSTHDVRAWTFRSDAPFLGHAAGMDFVSARVGWVWSLSPAGTVRLWETRSGGLRWTPFNPHGLA